MVWWSRASFLKRLGVEIRVKALAEQASEKQLKDLMSGLRRLTHSDEMGSLFKVIGFSHDHTLNLAGF